MHCVIYHGAELSQSTGKWLTESLKKSKSIVET